jgi:hypothetical protein
VATYEVGQTLVFGLKTYDAAGALADVGVTPTATLTKPDGTTATASVTKTATGTYTATYTSTAAGRWRCTWTGSGANSGGLPYVDVADVWPADPRLIISLGDARAALNLASSAVTSDDEIRLYIAAATEVVESIAGPQLAASHTETHTGGGYALGLFHKATAITAVTEDGTALTSGDYSLDTNSGLLWRGTYPGAATWSADTTAGISVTYTVGASAIAPNVILAARELVRHLYAIGQQPWRQPYGGGIEDALMSTTPSGYAVPNRVLDLLKPSMAGRLPGFA